MSNPQGSVFCVVPAGDKWGVATDGELLVLTASRRDAEALAAAAARVLASEAPWRPRVAAERRSFGHED